MFSVRRIGQKMVHKGHTLSEPTLPACVSHYASQKMAQRLLLYPCRNFSVRPWDYQRRASNHFCWAAFSVWNTGTPLFVTLTCVGRKG